MQDQFATSHLVRVLRNTLKRLEESGAFDQEDAASIHLKRRLMLTIAELDMEKDNKTGEEIVEPVEREKPLTVLRLRKPVQSNP